MREETNAGYGEEKKRTEEQKRRREEKRTPRLSTQAGASRKPWEEGAGAGYSSPGTVYNRHTRPYSVREVQLSLSPPRFSGRHLAYGSQAGDTGAEASHSNHRYVHSILHEQHIVHAQIPKHMNGYVGYGACGAHRSFPRKASMLAVKCHTGLNGFDAPNTFHVAL